MKDLTKAINDKLREKGDKTTNGMIILLKEDEVLEIMGSVKKIEKVNLSIDKEQTMA